MTTARPCIDCSATLGELHQPGCDVETCARCGGQEISCGCIYEVCGIEQDETMEKLHPAIFNDGPTAEMYAQWDREWDARRIPWAGEMHGLAECREFGFWCLWVPSPEPFMPGGIGKWVTVPAGTPDAMEDRNQLFQRCAWDADVQRWRLR